jgi:hypothetical protein
MIGNLSVGFGFIPCVLYCTCLRFQLAVHRVFVVPAAMLFMINCCQTLQVCPMAFLVAKATTDGKVSALVIGLDGHVGAAERVSHRLSQLKAAVIPVSRFERRAFSMLHSISSLSRDVNASLAAADVLGTYVVSVSSAAIFALPNLGNITAEAMHQLMAMPVVEGHALDGDDEDDDGNTPLQSVVQDLTEANGMCVFLEEQWAQVGDLCRSGMRVGWNGSNITQLVALVSTILVVLKSMSFHLKHAFDWLQHIYEQEMNDVAATIMAKG